MTPNTEPQKEASLLNTITFLIGALLFVVSLLGVLNTAMGWHLAIGKRGSMAALPTSWDAAIGLVVASLLWLGIWALLTLVPPIRDFGRRKPWIMTLLVIGGIVGAIIGITIWDNNNRAKRDAELRAEATADSLKRIDESKIYFGDAPVPMRVAVLNPTDGPLTLMINDSSYGVVAPWRMVEAALPWEAAHLRLLKPQGAEAYAMDIKPEAGEKQDPAVLHIWNPENTRLGLFDYDGAYSGGKLNKELTPEPDYVDLLAYGEYITTEIGGPFFVFPNEPAPESPKYKVYRIVILPAELEGGKEDREFAAWIMHHTDNMSAQETPESPSLQFERWEAEN